MDVIFLHFGRGISYASYLYNPNTWFSGIIILFFLMVPNAGINLKKTFYKMDQYSSNDSLLINAEDNRFFWDFLCDAPDD